MNSQGGSNDAEQQPVAGKPRGETRSNRRPIDLRGAMLATLTAALWGGTPVAISFTVDELPPLFVAAIRFAIATLFMLAWCWRRSIRWRIGRNQWFAVLTTGVLLFLQIATFNLGIAWSSSSHATLLINLFVLWVAGIEHFAIGGERLSMRKLVGLGFAASAGIVILSTRNSAANHTDPATLAGDCLLVLSSVILAVKIIWTQRMLKYIAAAPLILWHDIVGVVLFLGASVCWESIPAVPISGATIWGLIYQGLFVAGFCFAVQAHLLDRHPAAQVSVFSCATPVFGVTAAVVLRGDPISNGLTLAAGFVVIGIWLVTRPARTQV